MEVTQFSASATANVFGFTNTGDKVTASASASASADTNYEDAFNMAMNIAYNVARSELETNIDIIQQTITIVQNEGLAGPTGPQGPQGIQGIQGPTGPTGPANNEQNQSLFGFSNTFEELNNFQLTKPTASTSPYYYNIQSNEKQGSYSNLTSGSSGPNNNVETIVFAKSNFFGSSFYLGGEFNDASGITVNNIAGYSSSNYGSSYFPLNNGLNGSVISIAYDSVNSGFFNDVLYAGGDFTDVSGVDFVDGSFNCIAKWDNNNWSPLGGGVSNPNYVPLISVVKLDPSNNNLYAGGNFTDASGVLVNCIAKWDGINWSALGSGITNNIDTNVPVVYSIAFDSSNNLYVGGYFDNAGGVPVNNIAKWDGSKWTSLGSGVITSDTINNPAVGSLAFDSSNNLYVGGYFDNAGGVPVNNIAKWDGTKWSALGSGVTNNGNVYAQALAFDPSTNSLYVGGQFNNAGGVSVNSIAKWDGSNWSALGSGVTINGDFTQPGRISTFVIYNNNLYIGGYFNNAGGVAVSNIAKVELNFNNYVKNIDGTNLYLTYSGKGSQINLLYYDETTNLYSQVN
jgi:hypothetical protein